MPDCANIQTWPGLGCWWSFLSFTSGPAQGMHRYVLAAPPIYLLLSEWGVKPAFDRVWTITSVLLMGGSGDDVYV
ncbi:MAG: hypothetical protein HC804_02420 [Anaerolineae bacterium]|nr:hypothetical protein [Anaerolineae bacterium]